MRARSCVEPPFGRGALGVARFVRGADRRCRARPGRPEDPVGNRDPPAGLARPGEATAHRGVPIITLARTLLDLATVVTRRGLERAFEQSEALRLFDRAAVDAVLHAHRGRPGSPALAGVLATMDAGETLTRSELEERFLSLCDEHGFERPSVNATLEGLEVDFLWRAERVVVEADGHASHGTRAAFERDRARDARLVAAGFRVVRFTYRQVVQQRGVVAATVTSLLARCRRRGGRGRNMLSPCLRTLRSDRFGWRRSSRSS